MSEGSGLLTKSKLTTTELLRNLIHLKDDDDVEMSGAFELLNALAANTSLPGLIPQVTAAASSTGIVTKTKIVDCPHDKRIVVFSAAVSLNGVSNFKFIYNDSSVALLPLLAANIGQGYIDNNIRGDILKKGESLYFSNSGNVAYGYKISYGLLDG